MHRVNALDKSKKMERMATYLVAWIAHLSSSTLACPRFVGSEDTVVCQERSGYSIRQVRPGWFVKLSLEQDAPPKKRQVECLEAHFKKIYG